MSRCRNEFVAVPVAIPHPHENGKRAASFYHDFSRESARHTPKRAQRMRMLQRELQRRGRSSAANQAVRGTHCAPLRAEVQMATVTSLRDHLVEELNDLHNAEQQ